MDGLLGWGGVLEYTGWEVRVQQEGLGPHSYIYEMCYECEALRGIQVIPFSCP